MNQQRLQRLQWLVMTGLALSIVAAFTAPVYLCIGMNILCLAGVFWLATTARSQLTHQAILLSERVRVETCNQLMLEAATRQLIEKLEGRARLESLLTECTRLMGQLLEIADSLADNAALVQKDLSEFTPGITALLHAEEAAAEDLISKLSSLAETSSAKITTVTEAMEKLLSELNRQRQDSASQRSEFLAAAKSSLAEVEAGQGVLASNELALADWRRPIEEIGQAVQLATDLAEQTRILGVNASIEALRSGEAGRGFMLVAEEAERLSDRMVQVAHQIAVQIKEAEQAATRLTDGMTEVRGSLFRVSEFGQRLVGQEQVISSLEYIIPHEEVSLLTDLLTRLAAGVKSLHDHLANTFNRLDTIPAKEVQAEATRLYLETSKLVATSQAVRAKVEESHETARGIEADLVEVEEMGRNLEKVMAKGLQGQEVLDQNDMG